MVLRNGKNNLRFLELSMVAGVPLSEKISAEASLKRLDSRTQVRFIPPSERMDTRRRSCSAGEAADPLIRVFLSKIKSHF